MARCDCYHQHGLKFLCYGTKEMEECSCGGDESKCNFYPEKRKQAAQKATDIIDKITSFMKAQQEAEQEGRHEFTCPLCGGKAEWGRARDNNHLHCGCKGCGFRIVE